jgi:GNAT superfamily N-acetyltransferase
MSRLFVHYKNNFYRLLGRARHSETLEMLTLYECLYPNELGQIWVRPEELFHGVVELPQGRVPRFREVPLQVQASDDIHELWPLIAPLHRQTLGEPDLPRIASRLRQSDAIILVGLFDGDPVGFKLGHREKDGSAFESWLGGVRADRRRLGVATQLLNEQHRRIWDKGYRRIRTKTLNDKPEMLRLNLHAGFRVMGTEDSPRGLKIVLEKILEHRPDVEVEPAR